MRTASILRVAREKEIDLERESRKKDESTYAVLERKGEKRRRRRTRRKRRRRRRRRIVGEETRKGKE